MRTTLNLDKDLVDKARKMTGIDEKTALIHAGLDALIARESARRLAALGGTMPRLEATPRTRPRIPRRVDARRLGTSAAKRRSRTPESRQ